MPEASTVSADSHEVCKKRETGRRTFVVAARLIEDEAQRHGLAH